MDYEDEINELDPNSWPSDMLDKIYGDKDLPCLVCILQSNCRRIYESMCNDRYNYYKDKLTKRV